LVVAFGLFNWIEVGALEILDHRKREEELVVDVADDSRDLGPGKALRRAESPLAGDELEAIAAWGWADGDWLEQTTDAERSLEIGEIFLAEFFPGL
jgi:hypothetical protein